MKIHITGGKGFLGAYLTETLSDHSIEISDVDTLDVTDLNSTIEQIKASQADVICHLAGLTGAGASIKDPYQFFNVNCIGTLNVLEACRLAGIDKFIFISTLTVHGASDGAPVDEQSPFNPKHPYAASKASAEIMIESYARNYGIKSVTLRPTLIAGEGQSEPNAVTEFVQAMLEEGKVEIFGDGAHEREWLHPSDFARAVKAAVEYIPAMQESCQTFIISSGKPVSMLGLAEQIKSTLKQGEVEFRPSTRQAFSLCSKPVKARDTLKWQPQVNIDEIIQRISNKQNAKDLKGV